MYRLDVYHPDSATPSESLHTRNAAEALAAVSELLSKHAGCERVVVHHHGQPLFAVDCHGATVKI